MMRLLVTGGAGYIGSVVAAMLLDNGHEVTVLDDLSTGHEDAVPDGAKFVRGTLRADAAPLMRDERFDAVLHFAAKSLVAESVAHPDRYWSNNLGGTLALLDAMRQGGTRSIVFSSTAAVYGEPETNPIEETAPTRPVNPYGQARGRYRAHRVRQAIRLRRGQPAVLQRGGRPPPRQRRVARRAARPRKPPDTECAQGSGNTRAR
jgi:UDP-glucose 4-epimerase